MFHQHFSDSLLKSFPWACGWCGCLYATVWKNSSQNISLEEKKQRTTKIRLFSSRQVSCDHTQTHSDACVEKFRRNFISTCTDLELWKLLECMGCSWSKKWDKPACEVKLNQPFSSTCHLYVPAAGGVWWLSKMNLWPDMRDSYQTGASRNESPKCYGCVSENSSVFVRSFFYEFSCVLNERRKVNRENSVAETF